MNNKNYITYGAIVLVTLVLCGISFGLGVSYQKGNQSSVATTDTEDQQPALSARALGGGPGGLAGGQRPNIGEVKSVSRSSITISNQISGSDQTLKITSDTTVDNNGTTASVGDIKKGDTVLIIASTSDSSTAGQIMVNPNIGGGQPGGPPQNTTP